MKTVRYTAAQAAVRYLASQHVATASGEVRYFAGVWAIFGHGNVAVHLAIDGDGFGFYLTPNISVFTDG